MTSLKMEPRGIEFEEKVAELVAVLEIHVQCHRDLVQVLRERRDTLVGMQFDELEKHLETERQVIERIGEVETQRLDLVAELASQVGSEAGASMRIAELVIHVDDAAQEELLDLRDEIRDLADELDRINSLNRTLTLRSMDHIHMYIALLGGKDPDAKTYTKQGIQGDDPSSLVLDRLV